MATEVRKLLVRFPNTIKIVFDHRGLGDAFPQFMSQPWIDPNTKKEHPPIVMDDERSLINNALPLLRPVLANAAINQQMVSATTVAFEQGSIELPVSSKKILGARITMEENEEDAMEDAAEDKKGLTMEEKAIFIEADALQIEMGNIVGKETQSGAIIYDTAKTNQHKDRYSALGMGLRFISELEDYRKKRIAQKRQTACIGIVSKF